MEQEILKYVIYLVVGILYYLLMRLLKMKKFEKEFAIATDIVKEIFAYVEQVATQKKLKSEEKKQLALTLIDNALKKVNIKLDKNILEALIESTVFWFNYEAKQPEQGTDAIGFEVDIPEEEEWEDD